jgi:hypothetical protein
VIAQLWKLLKQFPALLFKRFPALLCSFLQFFLGRKRPVEKCVCPPALVKPDPFIYDQYYLTSLGLPVTWDNPDVFIYQGSALVDPHNLVANTPYTVVVRIWNNSTDVPVANLAVNFSYLSFGAGTQSNPIGTVTTDLNAKGLPGCPAFAYITWTTPPVVGHYCLQVLLEPPDDSNWANNLATPTSRTPRAPPLFHSRSEITASRALATCGSPSTRIRFRRYRHAAIRNIPSKKPLPRFRPDGASRLRQTNSNWRRAKNKQSAQRSHRHRALPDKCRST